MGAVAPDGSARGRAPVVAAELVHRVARVVGGHAARRVEGRARQPRRHRVVAQEEDAGAGEVVGAALRDHVHGPAARAARLGRVPARHDLELLHGFLRDEGPAALARQPAPPEAEEGALRVGAVDGEAGVHGALAAQRDAAARVELHRRLQQGEPHEVAARDGQAGDLVLGHVVGGPRPPHLDERGPRGDVDGLLDRGQAEPQVDLEALPDEEAHVLAPDGAEAGQRRHQVVLAARHRAEGEEAPPVGDRGAALAALDVHQLDRHPGQARAGVVGHEALHRRERLGGGRGGGEGEDEQGGGRRRRAQARAARRGGVTGHGATPRHRRKASTSMPPVIGFSSAVHVGNCTGRGSPPTSSIGRCRSGYPNREPSRKGRSRPAALLAIGGGRPPRPADVPPRTDCRRSGPTVSPPAERSRSAGGRRVSPAASRR